MQRLMRPAFNVTTRSLGRALFQSVSSHFGFCSLLASCARRNLTSTKILLLRIRVRTGTSTPSNVACRPFSSSSSSSPSHAPAHEVLGLTVAESRDYVTVKRAFLLLAKRTHPDTATSPYQYTFGQVRSAFEHLLSTPHLSRSSSGEAGVILSAFDNWFSEASNGTEGGSNVHAFRADEETLREIAEASELARGGLDRGGMWALADMIAAKEREERERN